MPRPKAERCERFTITDLRGLVQRGEPSCCLPDGTALRLQWRPVRGCYGGSGLAALIACPAGCGRWCRVLWRAPSPESADAVEPGLGWGCWACRPVSHRSHRRPGSHRTRKPAVWHHDAVCAQQDRIAEMLGLAHVGLRSWRPTRLIWGLADLRSHPRRPDAPRLSARRRDALERRLNALESVRVLRIIGAAPVPLVGPQDDTPKLMLAHARLVMAETRWAMRRTPRDCRSLVKPG